MNELEPSGKNLIFLAIMTEPLKEKEAVLSAD